MRWVLIGIGVIVALGVLAFLVGMLLPRNHQASSEVVVQQPIERVWETVRGLGDTPSFWPELKEATRLPDTGGKETWSQEMTNGFSMSLAVEEEAPPRRLVTRIVTDAKSPFGGIWRYELEPADGGTRVRVTEEGWVSPPLFRVISRIMGYHRTLDSYLGALARKFGETDRPRHVPTG